jgi:hypothetical protein
MFWLTQGIRRSKSCGQLELLMMSNQDFIRGETASSLAGFDCQRQCWNRSVTERECLYEPASIKTEVIGRAICPSARQREKGYHLVHENARPVSELETNMTRGEELKSTPTRIPNVGRMAERIVSNELEFRGFRVTDLNKDGTAANADLLAVCGDCIRQIQVKGATEDSGWWIHYGYSTQSIITNRDEPIFNRHSSFYKADTVVLVSVKSPSDYCCIVLPVTVAEEVAQMNLDREYRTPTRDGKAKKPGPVWIALDWTPNTTPERRRSFDREREILNAHRDRWDFLLQAGSAAAL